MENEARACGLFSVRAAENFAQFRVFPDSGMRRRQNFPSAAPTPRRASGSPDSGSRFPHPGRMRFPDMLQPFVFKASSMMKKNLRPSPRSATGFRVRRAGKRPRRPVFFFNKSVDIAKTLDLAFTCVPRESSRVIKTSSTIQANAIDCLPAIEKSSSPAKTVSEPKRPLRPFHGTRLRKASGVFFSAGMPAVLPGVLPGHCSTWAL